MRRMNTKRSGSALMPASSASPTPETDRPATRMTPDTNVSGAWEPATVFATQAGVKGITILSQSLLA